MLQQEPAPPPDEQRSILAAVGSGEEEASPRGESASPPATPKPAPGVKTGLHALLPSRLEATFFVLGVGILLPFNALLSVLDYYALLFPHISAAQYITNCYTASFLCATACVTLAPPPPRLRDPAILACFAALATVSALFPRVAAADRPFESARAALASPALAGTLLCTAAVGVADGLVQSTLHGLLPFLPGGACTTALNAGSAVASLLLFALRAATRLWLDGDTPSPHALRRGFDAFFALCATLCTLCVGLFAWTCAASPEYKRHVRDRYALGASHTAPAVAPDPAPASVEQKSLSSRVKELGAVAGDCRVPAACMLACFTQTVLLFPAVLATAPTGLRGAAPAEASWNPLLAVGLFAAGDLCGRVALSGSGAARARAGLLARVSVARALTLPVYVLAWGGGLPVCWAFVRGLVLLHGFGNGFVMNLAFLVAPDCTSPARRDTAGQLMFGVLVLGLFCGSSLSWVLERALKALTSF